jgi:hypothetical protein
MAGEHEDGAVSRRRFLKASAVAAAALAASASWEHGSPRAAGAAGPLSPLQPPPDELLITIRQLNSSGTIDVNALTSVLGAILYPIGWTPQDTPTKRRDAGERDAELGDRRRARLFYPGGSGWPSRCGRGLRKGLALRLPHALGKQPVADCALGGDCGSARHDARAEHTEPGVEAVPGKHASWRGGDATLRAWTHL